MFKRKKKKTGCETPEFRRPTPPPPPPTSGSNAVKPNISYGYQPIYTLTQNPPDTFSSLLKSAPVCVLPNDISTVDYICTYSTPCGWCTKWDKKCDKKIGCGDEKPQRGLRAETVLYDDAIPMPGLTAMLKGERYNDTIKIHFEGANNE